MNVFCRERTLETDKSEPIGTTFISRRKENEPFLHKGTDDTKELKQLFEKRFQIIQYNKIFVLSLTHLTAYALFGSAKFLKKISTYHF